MWCFWMITTFAQSFFISLGRTVPAQIVSCPLLRCCFTLQPPHGRIETKAKSTCQPVIYSSNSWKQSVFSLTHYFSICHGRVRSDVSAHTWRNKNCFLNMRQQQQPESGSFRSDAWCSMMIPQCTSRCGTMTETWLKMNTEWLLRVFKPAPSQ